MKSLFLTVCLLIGLSSMSWAQTVPGTPVQQLPTRLDACGKMINNASGAGNTAVTATLTPNSSEAIYICSIEVSETANAAVTGATGASTTVTLTGCQNTILFYGDNSSLTIGQTKDFFHTYPVPMKCKMDTAVTAAWANTGQSTQTIRVTLTGYSAP